MKTMKISSGSVIFCNEYMLQCFNNYYSYHRFYIPGVRASYISILNRYQLRANLNPYIQCIQPDIPKTYGRYVSTRDNTTLDLEPTPGSNKATPSMTNGNGFGIFFVRGSQEGRVGNTTVPTILLRNDGKILIGNVMFWPKGASSTLHTSEIVKIVFEISMM